MATRCGFLKLETAPSRPPEPGGKVAREEKESYVFIYLNYLVTFAPYLFLVKITLEVAHKSPPNITVKLKRNKQQFIYRDSVV